MPYKITKRLELSGSHQLNLPYESKCTNVHGHNWIVEIEVSCRHLDPNGMVLDFGAIKETIMKFDHQHLNDWFEDEEMNATAENMARFFQQEMMAFIDMTVDDYADREVVVSKVTVQESEGNIACYIP